MIGSVFKGIHTTIFAYGITGAGTCYPFPTLFLFTTNQHHRIKSVLF